jgi:peptidoglycan/xylan/chitin deacetylase (PgdA/CDA1 family)
MKWKIPLLLLSLGLVGSSAIAASLMILPARHSETSQSSEPKTLASPLPNSLDDSLIQKGVNEILSVCFPKPVAAQGTESTETAQTAQTGEISASQPAQPSQNLATAPSPLVSPLEPASPQNTTSPQTTESSTDKTQETPRSLCQNLAASISLFPNANSSSEANHQSPSFLGKLAAQITPASDENKIVLPPVAPFPQINAQAKLASVPIIMYHDILPKKEVSWDVTPEELEAHFQEIKQQGLTPISPDMLLAHLRTGIPLPNKPVLLSFDDGYGGHYEYVYPLLKKYGYPAVFSIYLKKMEGTTKRSSLTWEQLQAMAADPLVTISAHSISHPPDLRPLTDDQLNQEIIISKRLLEERLGIPIHYFTYPEGKYDARVKQWVIAAGYQMAFSMDDNDEKYAGASPDLLSIGRFGQSNLKTAIASAWGGYPAPVPADQFNLTTPIEHREFKLNGNDIILVSGGTPRTIHADSRYQVPEILKGTGAVAGLDGTFFSLKSLNSNILIGPALSSNRGFVPGNKSENPKLTGRPLVLITTNWIKFIPFDPERHNTLAGIQAEANPTANSQTPQNSESPPVSSDAETTQNPNPITDAFVAGAWLVKDGKASTPESFGNLYGFDARRNRAFWGINQAGQPVLGVTQNLVDAVSLGQTLAQLGFRDAIMVDSGASTSLAYEGKSLVTYQPRPVPHVIALYPKTSSNRLVTPEPTPTPQSQ